MHRLAPVLFFAICLCAACGIGDQPCQPSLPVDSCSDNAVAVQALMDQHCAYCHGETPSAGAPGGFRLDIYDGASMGVLGTLQTQSRVLARSLDGTMPPAGPPALTAAELKTLESWNSCQCSVLGDE